MSAAAKSETIKFDDIATGSAGTAAIPAGYDGFTWSDSLSVVRPGADAAAQAGDGFFTGLVSGKQEIYNGVPVVTGGETGESVSIGADHAFDLKGFDVTAVNDKKLQIEIKAFGDKVSFDEHITITDAGPYHVKLNLTDIKTLEIIPGKETPDTRFDDSVKDTFVLDNLKVGPNTAPFDNSHQVLEAHSFHTEMLSVGHPIA